MIYYHVGGHFTLYNIFKWRGSSFPLALFYAVPCGLLSGFIKLCLIQDYLKAREIVGSAYIVENNAVWTGFTFAVAFLVIFRTSQAYNRFTEGCFDTHKMRAEWFDACNGLIAFCRYGKDKSEDKERKSYELQLLIVRLFSMLHAVALAEIEDSNTKMIHDIQAFKFELIDPSGVDQHSLQSIRRCESKPELLFFWINQVIVQGIESGLLTIPAPILSRTFHSLANGMVAFHDCVKLSSIPFPFPYTQACDTLLLLHWIFVPLIVSQWVSQVGWSFGFAFIQVFVLWSLNGIAREIENPFGDDSNDLDCNAMQHEMNRILLLLMNPDATRLPYLTREAAIAGEQYLAAKRDSFLDVWSSETSANEVIEVQGSCRKSVISVPSMSTSSATDSTVSKRATRKAKMVRMLTPHVELGPLRLCLNHLSDGMHAGVHAVSHAASHALHRSSTATLHEDDMRSSASAGGTPNGRPSHTVNRHVQIDEGPSQRHSRFSYDLNSSTASVGLQDLDGEYGRGFWDSTSGIHLPEATRCRVDWSKEESVPHTPPDDALCSLTPVVERPERI